MTGRAGRRPRGSATAVAAIGGLGVALLPGLLGLVPAHAVLAEEVPRTRVATTSTVKVTRDGQRAAHLSFRVRAANEAGVLNQRRSPGSSACVTSATTLSPRSSRRERQSYPTSL